MSGLCKTCKNPGEFYPSNPNQCKQCYKDSKARYRSTAKYLVTKRKYSKEWRDKNRDHALEKGKQTYAARKSNPDRAAVLMVTSRRNSIKAKNKAIPFTITALDISPLPDRCPVLDIPLFFGNGVFTDNSPTIDRLDPSLGYVPGNVMVISHRANTIKHNATVEELERVLEFVRRIRDISLSKE